MFKIRYRFICLIVGVLFILNAPAYAMEEEAKDDLTECTTPRKAYSWESIFGCTSEDAAKLGAADGYLIPPGPPSSHYVGHFVPDDAFGYAIRLGELEKEDDFQKKTFHVLPFVVTEGSDIIEIGCGRYFIAADKLDNILAILEKTLRTNSLTQEQKINCHIQIANLADRARYDKGYCNSKDTWGRTAWPDYDALYYSSVLELAPYFKEESEKALKKIYDLNMGDPDLAQWARYGCTAIEKAVYYCLPCSLYSPCEITTDFDNKFRESNKFHIATQDSFRNIRGYLSAESLVLYFLKRMVVAPAPAKS